MTLSLEPPAITMRALAAVALLALAACEARPPEVTLRVGVFPVQSFLPYYVMRDQGFDRKHGLRFEEASYAGGPAVIEAIADGRLDLGPVVATVPLMWAAERGLVPGKLVAVAANNFADEAHRGVAVIAANSVRRWDDLEGKKIGTHLRRSLSTAAGDIRLRQEGVRSYAFVEIDFSNMGLAVAGGNVAAALMDEPYLTQSLLRGDGALLGWVIGGPPLERMMFSSIVFSAEFHRRHPEAVKAYLRAHLAAVRWINDHPDQARRVIAQRLNLSPEVANKMNLMRWPLGARSDAALLEQTQKLLLEAGLMQQAVDVRILHDETLLGEVLRESR